MRHSSLPSRSLAGGAAALLLAACAVPGMGGAETGPKVPAAPFACALRAVQSGTGVEITGSLEAVRAVAGRYRLQLGQTGGSNGATIDQGGDFTAAAGETLTLGQIALSGATRLNGQLTVDWTGGTVTCPLTGL